MGIAAVNCVAVVLKVTMVAYRPTPYRLTRKSLIRIPAVTM